MFLQMLRSTVIVHLNNVGAQWFPPFDNSSVSTVLDLPLHARQCVVQAKNKVFMPHLTS